jgi:hypothetical protein
MEFKKLKKNRKDQTLKMAQRRCTLSALKFKVIALIFKNLIDSIKK